MGFIDLFVNMLEEPQVTIDLSKCLKTKYAGFKCDKCLKQCPNGAIEDDEGIKVSWESCDTCGLCCGICPSGAFTLEKPSYTQLVAAAQEKGSITLSCKRTESMGACTVPCLGYLPETLMMGLVLSCQKVRICFDPGKCASCTRKADLLIQQRLHRIQEFALMFGKGENLLVEDGQGPEVFTRGEFFEFFKDQSKTFINPLISGFFEKSQAESKEKNLPVKLQLFLNLVSETPLTEEPAVVKAENWPFCQVEVNDDCTGCGDCGLFCPTGAFRVDEGDKEGGLIHNSALCLNCGICITKCPRQAISKSKNLNLSQVLTGKNNLLRRLVGYSCSRCGSPVTIKQQEGEFCSKCQQESIHRFNSKTQLLNF